jgi:hypothetical protein
LPVHLLSDHSLLSDSDCFWSLVGRYYTPASGQFLSVDPLVDVTGQPYGYAGEDPVNGVDPMGLFWNPVSAAEGAWHDTVYTVDDIRHGAASASDWVAHHPADVGIALGAVALGATGVGLATDVGAVGTVALGGVSLVAGGGAVALDYNPCVKHADDAACVGMVMGGVGTLLSGAGTVMGGDLGMMYGYGSLAFAGVGTTVDLGSQLHPLLAEGAEAC